jgi:diguanylate cyclase (GGDEF)-like protein
MDTFSAVVAALQPRDRVTAARVVSTLALVAGGVTVLFAAVGPDSSVRTTPVSILVTIATSIVVVAAALALGRMHSRGNWFWVTFPFVATAAILALDLLTRDASVGAQIFFFFPALYAGFQLPRRGAVAVSLVCVAGEVIDTFSLLPWRHAMVQSGYLSAAIIASVYLLVVSGERQDALFAQLARQAAVDSLTGLVTRRVLDNAAVSALGGAASELGTGLILIDVDRFKEVNDEYGHPAGDEVLVQLAQLLMLDVRPSDTVSRMGGDEIAILLAGCSVDVVLARAEQFMWEVRAHPFQIASGVQVPVSISIGVAHLPTHGNDLRSLYSAADTSLYAAKRGGRNRIGPLPARQDDPTAHRSIA